MKVSNESLKQSSQSATTNLNDMILFAGNSNPKLAKDICDILGIKLGKSELRTFANGETRVCIGESLNDRKIYILETGASVYTNGKVQTVNDNIMNTYLLMRTCQRSACGKITCIMPNFPYARQDKKDAPRGAISSADIVDMLKLAGMKRLVCVELHNPCIQGFFQGKGKKRVDNLYTTDLIQEYFENFIFKEDDYQNDYIVVAPDAGAVSINEVFASKVGLNLAFLSKQRDYDTENQVSRSVLLSNCDFQGRTAIIVDDMLDTGGTIVKTVEVLKENGIKDVIVAVTHGLLSGPAIDRINQCNDIKFVIVSDSIDQTENLKRCDKLRVFTLAPLLAEVIRRIHSKTKGSVSELFKYSHK